VPRGQQVPKRIRPKIVDAGLDFPANDPAYRLLSTRNSHDLGE
jgi:hypothetical protein